MVSREESFIGDASIRIYEKIKDWGKISHPVGGLIPPKEDYEWDKLRDKFEKYGVNMNKGGLMFTIKWANKIMDATCPIAEEIGYHPIGLTDDLVTMCSELIKGMNKKEFVEQSDILRKEIVDGVENQILTSMKNKVNR